jgi:hypothetical protein
VTPQDLADAMLAQDFETLRDGLAPEVVLHSPITARFRFEGREEVVDILRLVRQRVDRLEYVHAYQQGADGTLVFRGLLGSQEFEGSDYIRFDSDGRVTEFRVFIRPLPALARLAGVLAPALAARRSRARGRLLRVLVAPLVAFNRAGDAVGSRLVR